MRKENLISMVEDRKDELIDLVSRLIRINSENPTGTQREVVSEAGRHSQQNGSAGQIRRHAAEESGLRVKKCVRNRGFSRIDL